MSLPGRNSFFWRLIAVVGACGLLLLVLNVAVFNTVREANAHLSKASQLELKRFAMQAELSWHAEGRQGLNAYLSDLRQREQIFAAVLDRHLVPLSTGEITDEQWEFLAMAVRVNARIIRPGGMAFVRLPFSDGSAKLVMQVPLRMSPQRVTAAWGVLLRWVIPTLLVLLIGILLYRLFNTPLAQLRRAAMALSSGSLDARVTPEVACRSDELGELARSFNHMATRLENAMAFQRQLLRDLSHELRTPLSRLRVAGEYECDASALRERLGREVAGMEKLIGDTLELVWLDTELPQLPLESVELGALWDVLVENACFESHWPAHALINELPKDCVVLGNLNGLAQAMENCLRNAIRHSPHQGVVRLGGVREGEYWRVWIEDQGAGVPLDALDSIFRPFTRLSASRPGGDGYGLGLAIARSMVELQGGKLWAEPGTRGLRLCFLLKVYKL